jgi:hypothetical protein
MQDKNVTYMTRAWLRALLKVKDDVFRVKIAVLLPVKAITKIYLRLRCDFTLTNKKLQLNFDVCQLPFKMYKNLKYLSREAIPLNPSVKRARQSVKNAKKEKIWKECEIHKNEEEKEGGLEHGVQPNIAHSN